MFFWHRFTLLLVAVALKNLASMKSTTVSYEVKTSEYQMLLQDDIKLEIKSAEQSVVKPSPLQFLEFALQKNVPVVGHLMSIGYAVTGNRKESRTISMQSHIWFHWIHL